MKNYLPVITKQYSLKIKTENIVYIQQQQRRLAIVTDDETFMCYENMDNIMSCLDQEFYRVMKKLTVNLSKIKAAQEQCLIFEGGQKLYLGKENYVRAKQKFAAYLRGLI